MPKKKVVVPRIPPRPRAQLVLDPDDAMWTPDEAALMIRVARKTVYGIPGLVKTRFRGRGRLRIVRYRAGDVRRFLKECRAVA